MNDSSTNKQNGHNEQPLVYFLPNQMNLSVYHPGSVNQEQIADMIDSKIKELGNLGVEGIRMKNVQPQNILTFQPPNNLEIQRPAFSLVPVELNSTSTSQGRLMQVLVGMYDRLKKDGPFDLGSGVSWQAVSPDWLLGSAGHGSPHPPSPGSWPLAKTALNKENWEFSLCDKDGRTYEWPSEFANGGANVHIAILDTVPCVFDLDEAYEAWHAENELINRLLEPKLDPELRLVTDIYTQIKLSDCHLARHGYEMGNHGFFITGEIADIAPESKIHLIKVFTLYGSASTFTIAQGLLRILTDREIKRPLIVNCSFGLAAPTPGQDDPDFPVDLRNSPARPDIEEHMQTSLRALFNELTNQEQVIVVAASGDDSDPKKGRALARYPAAYQKVIGVGALPKGFPRDKNGNFEAASYSNLADIPPNTGYMTLGGEPRRGNGVLGLYTSETPYYVPQPGENHQDNELPKDPKEPTRDRLRYNTHNQHGSAEWAGTSFAAPIITAILARWCGQRLNQPSPNISLQNARLALDSLSERVTTAAGEHVILVGQGLVKTP